MNLNPAQCRAARGHLGWTREDLATASGVSVETIKNFEMRLYRTLPSKREALIAALKSMALNSSRVASREGRAAQIVPIRSSQPRSRMSKPRRRTRPRPRAPLPPIGSYLLLFQAPDGTLHDPPIPLDQRLTDDELKEVVHAVHAKLRARGNE
jgi:DNA-binding XRE family transcriptional regulator